MSRLPWLLRRAKRILQTEGLIALVRRGFSFSVHLFFRYGSYYLCQYDMENVAGLYEADYMPRIDNFTMKIVSSNPEADKLEAEGLEFRSQVSNARKRLEKGAVAFCVFVGGEFINISWIALTEKTKESLDEPPFNVEFSKGEACGGNSWTNPEYRHMGLSTYSVFIWSEFLMRNGIRKCRVAWPKWNMASLLKAYAQYGPKVYAEARYLKVLWWGWWNEKPLEQPNEE